MKANELMIGDWVYNKNIDKPMQVYPMMFSQMFRQTPDATTEDYNIFPIPLTPEILENNGFNGDRDVRLLKQDNFSITVVWLNDGTIDINYFNTMDEELHLSLEYVHQLQHLLRLIGYEKEIIL